MLERYINCQSTIRIYPNSLATGSADQTTCINIMDWLRGNGFNGTFEVIYHDVNSNIILSLFGLPHDLPSDYVDDVRKIRFVKFADYYARLNEGKIEQVELAITASKGECLCVSSELNNHVDVPNTVYANDAILMNAKAAIVISPWMGPKSTQIIKLVDSDQTIYLTNTLMRKNSK